MDEIKERLVNGKSSEITVSSGNYTEEKQEAIKDEKPYKMKIIWWSVAVFSFMHIGAVYGLFLSKQWTTIAFAIFQYFFAGFGVTVGAHKYFTHRAFKANVELRLLLVLMQTTTFQFSVFTWSLKHRLHHKFTDTNADPHNSARGFFFSHIGWLLVERHPDVKRMGMQIDMSDLREDPIVMFQHNHYFKLMIISTIITPMLITYYCFGDSLAVAFFFSFLSRHVFLLNSTFFINSVAHLYGTRTFKSKISATDSIFNSMLTLGEGLLPNDSRNQRLKYLYFFLGFHNYHHSFPWDYKAPELPIYLFNITTAVIDFFAWLGWATDLKVASTKVVESQKLKNLLESQ
ncbi:unnamed protein product [Diamesa serratosioi]